MNLRGLPEPVPHHLTVKKNEHQAGPILGTTPTADPAEMGSFLYFLNLAAELEIQGSKVGLL